MKPKKSIREMLYYAWVHELLEYEYKQTFIKALEIAELLKKILHRHL
jgi:hypothetical protein